MAIRFLVNDGGKFRVRFAGAQGPTDVITVLQQNKDLQERFLKDFHAEAKMMEPIKGDLERYLDGDHKAFEKFWQQMRSTAIAPYNGPSWRLRA